MGGDLVMEPTLGVTGLFTPKVNTVVGVLRGITMFLVVENPGSSGVVGFHRVNVHEFHSAGGSDVSMQSSFQISSPMLAHVVDYCVSEFECGTFPANLANDIVWESIL